MHTPPVFSLLHGGRAVRILRLAALGTASLLAAACGMLPPPEPIVQGPTTARPPMPVMAPRQNGAIYQEVASGSGGFRGMFEDRRAHMVGDTITIVISNGIGVLNQNYVETSNVNVVEEMVNMIQTQRAYEINSKAVQTSDQMLEKLAQL